MEFPKPMWFSFTNQRRELSVRSTGRDVCTCERNMYVHGSHVSESARAQLRICCVDSVCTHKCVNVLVGRLSSGSGELT